jgi:hypothetical protein
MGSLLSITEIHEGSVLGSVRINDMRKRFEKAHKKVSLNIEKSKTTKQKPTVKDLFAMQERNASLTQLVSEIRSRNSHDKLDRDILRKLENQLKKYQEETQKMTDLYGPKNITRRKNIPKVSEVPKIEKTEHNKPKKPRKKRVPKEKDLGEK